MCEEGCGVRNVGCGMLRPPPPCGAQGLLLAVPQAWQDGQGRSGGRSHLPWSPLRAPARPCSPGARGAAAAPCPTTPPWAAPKAPPPCCASVSHSSCSWGRGPSGVLMFLGCINTEGDEVLAEVQRGSARAPVPDSPAGTGFPVVSLHHPPAPQRSCCEEERFVGTGLSLQQSGPQDLQ